MSQSSFLQQYLEPLDAALSDENIVEIVINPDGQVFSESHGQAHMLVMPDITIKGSSVMNLASAISSEIGLEMSKKSPVVSGKITYKSRPLRAQVVVPPAVEHGASITIRKYSEKKIDIEKMELLYGELVNLDDIRKENAQKIATLAKDGNIAAALRIAVDTRLNILISGGTSSGKTTFARSLLEMVDFNERVVTIEDAFELFAPQHNNVALLAERGENSSRTTDILLQSTLRMRPDRIIVGELRGSEAKTFLEAINTGHGGSFTTIHAETARKSIDRLAMLIMGTGMNISYEEVMKYCRGSIDAVIQLGRSGGKRGIAEIYLPNSE